MIWTALSFALKHRKIAGAVLVIMAATGLLLWFGAMRSEIKRLDTANEQNKANLKQCVRQFAINKEVMNEYKLQINNLNDRVSSFKRMHKNTCIPIISQPSSRVNDKAREGYAQRDGIDAYTLIDYAAECEGIRQKTIGLQSYINKQVNAQERLK